jgi:hypothetical protein
MTEEWRQETTTGLKTRHYEEQRERKSKEERISGGEHASELVYRQISSLQESLPGSFYLCEKSFLGIMRIFLYRISLY